MEGAETARARGARRGRGHRLLETVARGKVFDPTARLAHEVMVVTREVFGEFVTRELVVGDDSVHDAGFFEHDEVAVDGTLREAATAPADLRDRERPLGVGERFDELLAPRSESLLMRTQPARRPLAQ